MFCVLMKSPACGIRKEVAYLDILKRLKAQGADSVILGCTEVCLLLNAQNRGGPVYDTTQIHCQTAIRAALH
ncbi:MAG: hypothetical protein EBX06_14150 [Rhodobacteraceae bacterium]|nr:hypothetical protein [Rhodobacterales bacterium]NCV68377.1 hypothetical protein [Paracoccaceae bacterium]NCW04581.1 hypothetical protein [Paracoccaceae bacterium]NCW66498.1 hypothetical protein [Paracoccaceae bacterium]NCX08884.1 hypothetical protein [Paracoccaceae bacterium]